jgi:hypothetical protein
MAASSEFIQNKKNISTKNGNEMMLNAQIDS